MRKIAIWHNLPSGGGKRALYEHVRGLVARGHHVEAWCPPMANRDFLPLSDLAAEHVVDLAWPAPCKWTDRLHVTLQRQRDLAAMEAHCQRCAEQIDCGGFDVLFANSCQFLSASPIARFVQIPSLLYLQEPYRYLYEAMPRMWWVAQPAWERLGLGWSALKASLSDWRSVRNWRLQGREEATNAAAFTCILVNSRFSREVLLRAYGLDSEVCYLGVDTARFLDQGLPREDYVIGLGSITPNKNIALVIEALGRLPHPRPALVWVANNAWPWYLDEVSDLAKARGVEFRPLHRVSDEALVSALNRAVAMVYAPRLEPFGLAPLEAAACGLPVIAVAEGGVRETIEDGINGLLVEHDSDEVAAAIARVRDDPALARSLGRTGRANVERKWSLQAATDRLEAKLNRYAARPMAA